MRGYFWLVLAVLMIPCFSCATSDPVQVESAGDEVSGAIPADRLSTESAYHPWVWGIWEGRISADRTVVDMTPSRTAMFALNAVGFLEQNPCTTCLRVTGKKVVGPNRLDLTVAIRHPFPGHREYTAFDVFGLLTFPSDTRIAQHGWDSYALLRVPWRYDGASQVLNPDGCDSMCFDSPASANPDKPQCSLFIDGALGGEIFWIDEPYYTPVWAYRLFRTTEVRNMFEVGGMDSETYQLWLPEGQEIKFAYVVEAHWVPPDNMPVTDPVLDFPREANRLGPYRFEVLDISGPASDTADAQVHFKVYCTPMPDKDPFENPPSFFYRKEDWEPPIGNGAVFAFYPYYPPYHLLEDLQLLSYEGGAYEYVLTLHRWPQGPDRKPPGVYPYWINLYNPGEHTDYLPFKNPDHTEFVFEIEVQD